MSAAASSLAGTPLEETARFVAEDRQGLGHWTLLAVVVFALCCGAASAAPAAPIALQVKDTPAIVGANVGCTAETTKALVRSFVGDYNLGRVAAADRVWAPAPRFGWFSTGRPGARVGPRAKNRTSLSAYFRTRVKVHERLRVTELAAGYDPKRKLIHYSGKLLRSADDLRPKLRDFKGAADCVSGRPFLIVWSM